MIRFNPQKYMEEPEKIPQDILDKKYQEVPLDELK